MKTGFLYIFLIATINICFSQDTIFMKDGAVIPSKIIDKTDAEVKYRKYGPPESVGIYSVFIIDIAKLKFENGEIIECSMNEQDMLNSSNDELLPSNCWRWLFGVSTNYFSRNKSDNLITFWRYWNNNNSLNIGGDRMFFAINISMSATMGGGKRNWLGAKLQLIASPKDAIYAKNEFHGLNEIQLRSYFYNIIMFYGHSLNHRKDMVFIFEPSLDVGFMSGDITFYEKNYKVTGFSLNSHFATGLDWIITKRWLVSYRVGYRFMKMKEYHKTSASSTGSSTFYANPTVSNELVYVNWGGFYFNVGFSIALY